MRQVLATKEHILNFIPQRHPIVMVDKLYEITNGSCTTGFEIPTNNIFLSDGMLLDTGLIENIAQSSALMVGYHAKQNQEEIRKGFIGAVKNLNIYRLPEVNTEIETTINIQTQVLNVSIIEGTVTQKGNILATCTMNIFLEEK